MPDDRERYEALLTRTEELGQDVDDIREDVKRFMIRAHSRERRQRRRDFWVGSSLIAFAVVWQVVCG